MSELATATLVAWVRSWRAGLVSYDEVVDEVRGGTDHLVQGLPHPVGTVTLSQALAAFSRLRPDAVRLVLPTPGDPRGLPGPGPLTDAALRAGAAALCGDVGLVAGVTTHVSGSGDRWQTVRWCAYPGTAGHPDQLPVAEAEHDLALALHQTTDVLRDLGVARARPDLTAALTALRRQAHGPELPPGYDARSRRLAARAATVARILTLAAADAPGAAVTVSQAVQRDAALRPLAAAARRAQAAAINAPLC